LAELETFLTLSERLRLIRSETGDSLMGECAEINRMLESLMHSLSRRKGKGNSRE
jgi:four helix bundle protein